MLGRVKTLTEKGFGFITPDGGGKDVFFHMSALEGVSMTDLRHGDALEYETEDSPKGIRAVNVRFVGDAR